MSERDVFTTRVMKAYREPETVALSKSLFAAGDLRESGHPMFAGLEVGEARQSSVASVFLDLSDFTGRTYWDATADVARLADAVLSGFTGIVSQLGGHVLGLRGDGLYAGFGPIAESGVSVALAGLACAVALDSVRFGLNPRLKAEGIEPVKARAGIDFGEVAFVRSGVTDVSEVNVVGFSANFAAKAEKIANAWEVVVGQGFVDQMGDESLISRHEKSPKSFTRNYETKYYHFYQYQWANVLPDLDGVVAALAGKPLELLGK